MEINDTREFNEIFSMLPRTFPLVVDIGVHKGEFYDYVRNIKGFDTYIGFEPDPDNFDTLNWEIPNVRFIRSGVYYGKEQSKVYGIGDGNDGGYIVEIDPEHTEVVKHRLHQYPDKVFQLCTLESKIQSVPKGSLIKIDCEGSEYNIIENSTILSDFDYILIEFHNHDDGYIDNFLRSTLYYTHDLRRQGRQWFLQGFTGSLD